MEAHTTGASRVFLTARTGAAVVTSFLLVILLGPIVIRWLRARFRERIDSASEKLNELHSDKSDTPTMGGLFIVAAIVAAILLWGDLSNAYLQIGLFIALGFGALGAVDDWIKLRTSRRGLSVRQKLAVQVVLAAIAGGWLYTVQSSKPMGTDLVWPIGNAAIPLGIGFLGWCVLVLVGSSNGVNLTDGLDGLAIGATLIAAATYAIFSYVAGNRVLADYLQVPYVSGAGELAVFCAALVGASLGFLWFNCHPAEVIMGDVGSLAIGAAIGMVAVLAKQEIVLGLVAGLFVIEAASVIVQVVSFKTTGRRVFRMAPIHHHFELSGWSEPKVIVRFWILAILFSLMALATLKLR